MEQAKKGINMLLKVLFRLVEYLLNLAFRLLVFGLSMPGVFCIGYGFRIAFTDHVGLGLLLSATGAGLFLLAGAVTKGIRFWRWWQYIRRKGLEDTIRSDTRIAIQVYNACPGLLTRLYISRQNPSAASYIRQNSQRGKQKDSKNRV